MKLTLTPNLAMPPPAPRPAPLDVDGKPWIFHEGPDVVTAPLGVYVHFPWCLNKCPYCDFLSVVEPRQNIPHREYADAVIAELARRRPWTGDRQLGSVFFGGGTPSLWEPAEVGRVIEAIHEAYPRAGTAEVTLECNPTSFDRTRAIAFRNVGVNRISLGVQGLETERLRFLGRLHDPSGALAALDAAVTTGFSKVSADLIIGVAKQDPAVAAREATLLAELGVNHLSAYVLTIEGGTAFGSLARRGKLPLLDEDRVADSFLAVGSALAASGFEHYEISNYARNGEYAEHNLTYWHGRDYLGLGTGAWGTITGAAGALRYRNTPVAKRYLGSAADWAREPLTTPSELVQEVEALSLPARVSERLLLGLRLSEGVDLDAIERELGAEVWTAEREKAARRLVGDGLLQHDGGHLKIPPDKWLFADDVIRRLI